MIQDLEYEWGMHVVHILMQARKLFKTLGPKL